MNTIGITQDARRREQLQHTIRGVGKPEVYLLPEDLAALNQKLLDAANTNIFLDEPVANLPMEIRGQIEGGRARVDYVYLS